MFAHGNCRSGLVAVIGIVTYYKDFVESLYDQLGGNASITGKDGIVLVLSSFFLFSYVQMFYVVSVLIEFSALDLQLLATYPIPKRYFLHLSIRIFKLSALAPDVNYCLSNVTLIFNLELCRISAAISSWFLLFFDS